ncbi:hypothetical protein QTP88_019191 [Uroleucon formosanum]
MATGESFRSLAFAFRISQSYITRIVRLVLKSLSNRLTPILLPSPTKNDMVEISKEFWEKWNFLNCAGAIDGKHIRIFSPKNSESLFFNYKDFFSIVLLAIVDANCKFIYVDIGSYGKEGDSGIFTKSKITEQMKNGDYFPPNAKVPNSDKILPYVFIGNEAFRLVPHMMRPYSKIESRNDSEKKKFNYRLSRARRTTENSFGLLSQEKFGAETRDLHIHRINTTKISTRIIQGKSDQLLKNNSKTSAVDQRVSEVLTSI